MNRSFKKRFVAIHLSLSFIIALVLLALILLQWFPYPLLFLDGAWKALLLLLGIDLVLGPLLAWVVISDKKKKLSLIIDLFIIIILQVAALCYGIYSIHSQRVVALVFFENYFHLVSYELTGKEDFDNQNLKYYKGIAYGMMTQDRFTSQLLADVERTLYSPDVYQALNNHILTQPGSQEVELSEDLLKKYQGKRVYKIAGKQQNGAAILDQNYNIIELILVD